MMRPRSDVVAVSAAFVVAAVASTAGVAASTRVAVGVAVVVAVTAVVALFLDHFGGAVVGLAAAAVVILGRRISGSWDEEAFWLALLQTVALVATGIAAGRAGVALRRTATTPEGAATLPEPAFGSLGLLDADIALERLKEEVDRAHAHGRPLSLVVVDVHLLDPAMSREARRSAHRAVSRIFESRIGERDVPFALSEERLAAILPETSPAEAWDRIGSVLDAVAGGSFNIRSEENDRALADTVELAVGLAETGPGIVGADALLDAATAALPSHMHRDSGDLA